MFCKELLFLFMQIVQGIFLLQSFAESKLFGADSGFKVILKSTGPVTLDTPIWFTAEIFPYTKGTFTFEWEDNNYPRKWYKDSGQGPISKWSTIYSSDEYEMYTGLHKVRVRVKKYMLDLWLVAENEISFQLSDRLNGNLSIIQPNVTSSSRPGFVSTSNLTNITAVIHDPHDWIKNRTEKISFYWQITDKDRSNTTSIGPCRTPSLVVNISIPGNYFAMSNIILEMSDQPIPITTTTTTTTPTPSTTSSTTSSSTSNPSNITTSSTSTSPSSTLPPTTTAPPQPSPVTPPPPITYYCDGRWVDGPQQGLSNVVGQISERTYNKLGLFNSQIQAREPMHSFNFSGSTWIRHGVMVNISLDCLGSGPFQYCFNITYGALNESDPKICNYPSIDTHKCQYIFRRYFTLTGTYTLTVKMRNDVSEKLQRIAINIYNVEKKPQLWTIIIPISCSLLAIVIIIFGIDHFIESRKRYLIEVADFNFCAIEETEYRSFMDQLKTSLKSAFSADVENNVRPFRHNRTSVETPSILDDEY